MRLILIMLLAALAGCDRDPPVRAARATTKERADAAQAQLAKTPVPRVYRYGDGELRVFEVPVIIGRNLVDRQTCMVWRDAEYRTASLQCPADGAAGLEGPPPEQRYSP